jgi:hypothetical protein
MRGRTQSLRRMPNVSEEAVGRILEELIKTFRVRAQKGK